MIWHTLIVLLSAVLRFTSGGSLPLSLLNVNFDLASLGPAEVRKPAARPPFRHPGLLHTTDDFSRIKHQSQNGGWVSSRAYQGFLSDPHSDPDWRLRGPCKIIHRTTVADLESCFVAFSDDSEAARQLALLWAIDGHEKAGRKAVEILDKWGSRLKVVDGTGSQLFASLTGSVMVQAAEIMRHTSDFWSASSISTFENMLRNVLLPRITQSHPDSNLELPFSANWGTSAEKGMIAMSIFLNDYELYNMAKNAILYSPCANLTGIISPSGQSSDSGRDQQHTQLGLGNYAESFQMLWNQGDDFYQYAENRLMAGLEYTAQYLSGVEVTYDKSFFSCHCDVLGGPWTGISSVGRDLTRGIYEMAYAHYTFIKGYKMPWTEKLIKKHTPDGPSVPGILTDNASFQTFLFRQEGSMELNSS